MASRPVHGWLGVIFAGLLLFASAGVVQAQSANAYWKAITDLDAGPEVQASERDQVREAAISHLKRQERLLRTFLEKFPRDERWIEAQLKLAAVLGALARVGNDAALLAEAEALWRAIEQSEEASLDQKTAAAFSQLTTEWLTIDPAQMQRERDRFLQGARAFGQRYPSDARYAAMLMELSLLYPDKPEVQKAILREADVVATDPSVKARVADDLLRLSKLGLPMQAQFPILRGKAIEWKNGTRPTLLVFWSPQSPPSMELLAELKEILKEKADWRYQVVAVAVTEQPQSAVRWFDELQVPWILAGEEGGWMAPTIRKLGINALPTLWIIDREGIVRHVMAQRELDAALAQFAGE